ncbi:hypothetical protein LZL87_012569 [Fusarium oxysporum]|uniref:Uncharacterized protein n=1 Tax=Fusarium oxysporum f. sp. rapae TaxID=485398 RepID=A0A8J5TP30_FUSOX|nr:hypothetical protein Forpe1208_v013882 [Fusarium oxysporum f. sp. rapae]KAI7766331.1 hypothetical protein LZL87_012569 [Fusarium oxysporum]
MPAPLRPSRGRPPTFSKQDEDLWKAYAKALQTKFFSNLDTKNEIFYAAPIGLDAPVFTAGSTKYSQRLQEVLGLVRLNRNLDKGAEMRLNNIRSKLDKLNEQYAAASEKAMEGYKADENKGNQTFKQWIQKNYPNLVSLTAEKQSAAATEASLRSQMDGPGGAQLNGQRQKLLNATDSENDHPGLNMLCAPSFGNIINGSSDLPREGGKLPRPAYTIDNSYRDTIGNWIRGTSGETKLSLAFNINDAKSDNWDQLGFVNVNANAGRTYSTFFKASYVQDNQNREESIAAQDVGSELSVQLSAAEAGVFTVKPGEWDVPNITEEYPNFQPVAARDIGPAARVDQVILAYKVAMKLSLPANVAKRVNDLIHKAKSTGGSVSFFGFEIGFGGGSKDEVNISGSSIEIRKDLGYPVLLDVKGKKLPGLRR